MTLVCMHYFDLLLYVICHGMCHFVGKGKKKGETLKLENEPQEVNQ